MFESPKTKAELKEMSLRQLKDEMKKLMVDEITIESTHDNHKSHHSGLKTLLILMFKLYY